MTRLLVMVLLACIPGTYSKAIYGIFPVGARSRGLGGVHVMLADVWSGLHNEAGLSCVHGISVSLHAENRFLMPETGLGAFSLCIPVNRGTVGIQYASFGYSLYQESQVCLAYGKPFGSAFRAGIGLHCMKIRQAAGYGTLFALVPALGVQVIPVKGLTIGFHVLNPASQPFYPQGQLEMPALFNAGLGFSPGEELLICLEAEKESRGSTVFRGGFEYFLRDVICTRFGISYEKYPTWSLGIGFLYRGLKTDIAICRHPLLGFSPALTLSYSFP